jgi:hypothetical protein
MSAALGMISKLGIDSTDPVAKRFDFADGTQIGADEEFIDGNGLRGTLSHDISRVRRGNRRVSGQINMQPNAVELSYLLQWILGGSPTGSGTVTYPLADTLVTRYVAVDRNASTLFTYDAVAVDRATFRADQGSPLSLNLDVVGKDETQSGSFPSLTIDTANGPFIFTDCVVVIGGTTVDIRNFELVVENKIDRDRFFNSATLVTPNKQDRQIMFRTELPWGDYYALYNTGPSGVAITLTFTYGSAVLAFSLVKVAFPRKPFPPMGRRENMFMLEGNAYKSGSTLELVTTLNVGP